MPARPTCAVPCSLLELLDVIERVDGQRPEIRWGAWRPGDQRYYVSDTAKMRQLTGWEPKVGVEEGVNRLYEWLRENVHPRPRHTSESPGRRRRSRKVAALPGRNAWRTSKQETATLGKQVELSVRKELP